MKRLPGLLAVVALAACTPGPVATAPVAGPTVAVVASSAVSPTPTGTPAPTAPPTPAPTATPKPTAVTYAKLTSRQWAVLLKSPDSYVGQGYQVWACISTFNATTGPGAFLAQASYQLETYWYIKGVPAGFTGDPSKLAPFVKGDVVTMKVVVLGSAYGQVQFQVASIARKGSCDKYL